LLEILNLLLLTINFFGYFILFIPNSNNIFIRFLILFIKCVYLVVFLVYNIFKLGFYFILLIIYFYLKIVYSSRG